MQTPGLLSTICVFLEQHPAEVGQGGMVYA